MANAAEIILEEGVYLLELDEQGTMPAWLYLPQAYEPSYAYPLLVLLHGYGQSEQQWTDAITWLSRRNYVGLVLRGTSPLGDDGRQGYGWGRTRRGDGALEDYLHTAVEGTSQVCNIHPQRVFLVGFCEGAMIAYRMGLSFPDRFAGIVAINGWLPPGPLPLCRARACRSLGVWIAHGERNEQVLPEQAAQAHRVLYTAGLPVERRCYAAGHQILPSMLRDVDRWLLARCGALG